MSIFNMIKKDKNFIINIYRNVPSDYLHRYLYKATYQLLYNVLEEKAKGMVIREEDKAFIANFYKYGFVGLLLEWIDNGMKDEPALIVERLNSLIQGNFEQALNNAKLNK